jgi:energy-converting hydrogenase A subunit M
MLVYNVAYEVIKNKSVKISSICYADTWTAKEDIGIFSFDKVIYKDLDCGEFLAVKRPRKSQIWKSYRYREDIVKVVYLNSVLDDGVWIWLLTEDWSKNRVESLKAEMQEVLERFRRRMKEYNEEFFGGKRVADYIWQQLLHFEVIERMNAPNALIVSYLEPIRRYFRPLPIIIDMSQD